MRKEWFNLKERGAGKKRLILTWYLYKLFGNISLRLIGFFTALFVFIFVKERRNAGIKFFKILNKKHPLFDTLKLFINYAFCLGDKIKSFAGDMSPHDFILLPQENFKGTFYITTHIGNIEILRSLFTEGDKVKVNIFMQKKSCEIFNSFLKTIEKPVNIDTFAVEEIGIETSILIKEKLQNGEIVFMAGDRLSAQNEDSCYETKILEHKTYLPIGTLKFAIMMECPIKFIICVKENKKYKIIIKDFMPSSEKKSETLEELKESYTKFLEEYSQKYPHQVYNFHDAYS